MKALESQVQAFGLLGAYLNEVFPPGRLTDAEGRSLEALRKIGPDELQKTDFSALETPKVVTEGASWLLERRLDITDLDRFNEMRLAPCEPLIKLAEQRNNCRPDPDLPLIYQTIGWPSDAPPAGRIREAADFTWTNLLTSYQAMWRLQLNRPQGNWLATVHTANKMTRAALWVARTDGFLPAIEYLFELVDRGFVIDSHAAVITVSRLFLSRRQVDADAELPGHMLNDATLDAHRWKDTEFRIPRLTTPKRVIDDDAEFALSLVAKREQTARQSSDLDTWLLSYARLGLAARATHLALRTVGLDQDLAYASHAARLEEISCDVSAFFNSFAKQAADGSYRMQPFWGKATFFALNAKKQSPGWLEYMLQERVVLPNALADGFRSAPLSFTPPPEWQSPSVILAPIIGALCFRNARFGDHRVRQGDSTTRAIVAETLQTLGRTDCDELPERASALWPLFRQEAVSGPPPHDPDGEILQNFLLFLATQMPEDRASAIAWLDHLHLDLSQSCFDRTSSEPETPGSLADHDERLQRARTVATDYPYSGEARHQLALRLWESGRNAEARQRAEDAILLDPTNRRSWLAVALVALSAGDSDDEQIAAAMAKAIELMEVAGLQKAGN